MFIQRRTEDGGGFRDRRLSHRVHGRLSYEDSEAQERQMAQDVWRRGQQNSDPGVCWKGWPAVAGVHIGSVGGLERAVHLPDQFQDQGCLLCEKEQGRPD